MQSSSSISKNLLSNFTGWQPSDFISAFKHFGQPGKMKLYVETNIMIWIEEIIIVLYFILNF